MSLNNISIENFELRLEDLDRLDSVVVFISDYNTGSILYASPSSQQILGYSAMYFLEKGYDGFYMHCHPEDLAAGNKEIAAYNYQMQQEEFTTNKIHSYPFESRFKHGNGTWIWFLGEAYMISITENHKPQRFVTILRDYIKQKAAEQFLLDQLMQREPDPKKQNEIRLKYLEIKDPLSELPIPKDLIEISVRSFPQNNLSDREKEVLRLIAKGYTSKKAAEELGITEHTAETHRKNILVKFNVSNTAELIKEANRSYWLGN